MPLPDRAPPARPETSEDWRSGGFGLYVHWPFCKAKCPYCDFNSHVSAQVDQSRWRRAFRRALEVEAAATPGRRLESIFFGGGTPSLMEPETVALVLDSARELWPQVPDLEVTLEANPTSVESGRFRAYAEAGVNRLSMGVQALNDADLKALGRQHDAAEARAAFEVARGIFPRVSFDLIYARQRQSLEDWRKELALALSMAVDHFSLYQLTIEAGTVFGRLHGLGKLKGLPGPDLGADFYDATQEICEAAGLPAYEISNHARPGAECRHNLVYWRYGDYVGVGPGAHGRITRDGRRFAVETHRAPELWLAAAERDGAGRLHEEEIAPEDQATEHLIMGLRLAEGLDMARHARLSGRAFDPGRVLRLEEEGFLRREGGRLIATAAGRRTLDAVILELAR
ncbi:radical SAM family heme chaperone HemW [Neomegalonema sp.]|uniref:radical SAM family heme chaperone HemW n=1 Tax=Neomegalonema sp. TaxID=2039713 RepID=UPI00261BAD36|nr:radical SAM family heme chaperone HemW [Neomegalonema sp.]MDD2869826.1 radical SAM family heme chaperone HemW [Neomegalonema sp.]